MVTVLLASITSPIVVDLNGDGVRAVSLAKSVGRFDLLNTGTPILSGWISADAAFLAVDTNANGVIDDRSAFRRRDRRGLREARHLRQQSRRHRGRTRRAIRRPHALARLER